jgi:hypothetical protein
MGIKRGTPPEDRFWQHVEKTDTCWNWTRSVSSSGYGQISSGLNDAKPINTHRLSWRIHFGDIPAGQWVLHRCDNKRCVRPDHLFLGTLQDNVSDMMAKGRDYRGEPKRGDKNAKAKLTWSQVRAIRHLYSAGHVGAALLAPLYNISGTQAKNIVSGKCWKEAAC